MFKEKCSATDFVNLKYTFATVVLISSCLISIHSEFLEHEYIFCKCTQCYFVCEYSFYETFARFCNSFRVLVGFHFSVACDSWLECASLFVAETWISLPVLSQ